MKRVFVKVGRMKCPEDEMSKDEKGKQRIKSTWMKRLKDEKGL